MPLFFFVGAALLTTGDLARVVCPTPVLEPQPCQICFFISILLVYVFLNCPSCMGSVEKRRFLLVDVLFRAVLSVLDTRWRVCVLRLSVV